MSVAQTRPTRRSRTRRWATAGLPPPCGASVDRLFALSAGSLQEAGAVGRRSMVVAPSGEGGRFRNRVVMARLSRRGQLADRYVGLVNPSRMASRDASPRVLTSSFRRMADTWWATVLSDT